MKKKMALTDNYIVDDQDYYLAWLEIIASIDEIEYPKEYSHKASFKNISKDYKLKGTVKIGGNIGYEITLTANGLFVYRPDKDEKETEDKRNFCKMRIFSEIYP